MKQVCGICGDYINRNEVSIRVKAKHAFEVYCIVHKQCVREKFKFRVLRRNGTVPKKDNPAVTFLHALKPTSGARRLKDNTKNQLNVYRKRHLPKSIRSMMSRVGGII
jgi:hypothetical protein